MECIQESLSSPLKPTISILVPQKDTISLGSIGVYVSKILIHWTFLNKSSGKRLFVKPVLNYSQTDHYFDFTEIFINSYVEVCTYKSTIDIHPIEICNNIKLLR